ALSKACITSFFPQPVHCLILSESQEDRKPGKILHPVGLILEGYYLSKVFISITPDSISKAKIEARPDSKFTPLCAKYQRPEGVRRNQAFFLVASFSESQNASFLRVLIVV